MLEKVAAIIREQLNQENVEITETTRFKEDLEVDSLDLFELVMAFEEEYGVCPFLPRNWKIWQQ